MTAQATKIKSFVMESGERYCLLIDAASGLPLYYPNLFVTSQVRNASLSKAAMETALNAIQVLLRFCSTQGIDLISRFRLRRFMTIPEIDGIRDACQKRLSTPQSPRVVPIRGAQSYAGRHPKPVGKPAEYVRITYIAKYLKWLAEILLAGEIDNDTAARLEQMASQLNARRPPHKGRSRVERTKGLDEHQVEIIAEIIRPGSLVNPFKGHGVQYRNFAIILLLRYLGIRAGELLNIKGSDIKTDTNHIVIARRADLMIHVALPSSMEFKSNSIHDR